MPCPSSSSAWSVMPGERVARREFGRSPTGGGGTDRCRDEVLIVIITDSGMHGVADLPARERSRSPDSGFGWPPRMAGTGSLCPHRPASVETHLRRLRVRSRPGSHCQHWTGAGPRQPRRSRGRSRAEATDPRAWYRGSCRRQGDASGVQTLVSVADRADSVFRTRPTVCKTAAKAVGVRLPPGPPCLKSTPRGNSSRTPHRGNRLARPFSLPTGLPFRTLAYGRLSATIG